MTIDLEGIDPTNPTPALIEMGKAIRHDPVYMANKLIGSVYYGRQRDIVLSVLGQDRRMKVAWVTGHGLGKTYSTADIIILWMLSHPPCYVVVMSSTWEALKKKTIAALRNRIRNMRIKFFDKRELPNTESWDLGDEWAVIGVSPKDVEAIHGWHSKGGTLFLVDEGSVLDADVFEGMNTQVKSYLDGFLIMGNPIRGEGPFAEIALGNEPGWFVGNIPSWESPNYIAVRQAIEAGKLTHAEAMRGMGPLPVPGLQTYLWVETMRLKHGEESPIWQARVAGQVPDQAEDIFIPRSTIRQCEVAELRYRTDGPTWLLADVARSEQGDRTIFMVYKPACKRIIFESQERGLDAPTIVNKVKRLYKQHNCDLFKVERNGMSGAIYDYAVKAGLRTEGIWMSERAKDNKIYKNIRAEAWDLMRQAMTLPPSQRLQLTTDQVAQMMEASRVKRKESDDGKVQLESKKDMKERGIPSPDYADTLALAFAQKPGDIIFRAAASMYHRMDGDLSVYRDPMPDPNDMAPYLLFLKDVPRINYGNMQNPRNGTLHRAMWYGGWKSPSAAVLVHIDRDGTWTVFDGFKNDEGISLEMFVKKTMEMCREPGRWGGWFQFTTDVFSNPSSADTRAGMPISAVLHKYLLEWPVTDADKANGRPPLPAPVPESAISHMAGFDVLNDLLRSTTARFDDVDPGEDGMGELRGEQIYVKPVDIAEELENARLQSRSPAALDEEDGPSTAIAGGGAYVRCLRLLAVNWAGVML